MEPEKKILTGNALKLIAMITMLIDHIAYVILERGILYRVVYVNGEAIHELRDSNQFLEIVNLVLRGVGRIAFVIFLFLLVEGFIHTSNVFKYALRLGIFAIISEIPFNIAFSGKVFDIENQNVFFTLFISLIMMCGFEALHDHFYESHYALYFILSILVWFAASAAAAFLKTDYGAMGVSMAAVMYLLRNKPGQRSLVLGIVIFIFCIVSPNLSGEKYEIIREYFGYSSILELVGLVAFAFISRYNGERGSFRHKYAFYLFYPVHLLILGLITAFSLGIGLIIK